MNNTIAMIKLCCLVVKVGKTDRMMAEIYGRKTGYNKGKGGLRFPGKDTQIVGSLSPTVRQ